MNIVSKFSTISEAEYLAGEQLSDIKHEYIDGHVYAMVGAHSNHNVISVNLLKKLANHLETKPCQPYTSDMKVKIGSKYFYPDAMVDCTDVDGYFTESPTLIVEVLSKSTRQHDKTFKRDQYIKIPTLQEYILIEQDFVDVEIQRRSNGWQSEHFYLDDAVIFESIGLQTTVSAIYERVKNEDMLKWQEQKAEQLAEPEQLSE
ncbi:Uma2 family endonuclease [Alkanindiges sp. WGS2144]|uniref:Uma2 family endonuclease n=1 Tax=Alkanindiges sp. WGS2144 TaxID=3366808 RepID=UPI003750A629